MSSDWGFGALDGPGDDEEFWLEVGALQEAGRDWPNNIADPFLEIERRVDLTTPPSGPANTVGATRPRNLDLSLPATLPATFTQDLPPQQQLLHPIYSPRSGNIVPQQQQATDDSNTTSDSDMPPTSRRLATSTIDLTQSPPNETIHRTLKRSAASSTDLAAVKKRRASGTTRASALRVEELEDEAPGAEDELAGQEQMNALKQQEAGRNAGPVKVGQMTCIICLDNFTNATTSICGHIFCHECLTRALIASEKNSQHENKGNCPACRKVLDRKKPNQVVAINFMRKEAFNTKGRGREL